MVARVFALFKSCSIAISRLSSNAQMRVSSDMVVVYVTFDEHRRNRGPYVRLYLRTRQTNKEAIRANYYLYLSFSDKFLFFLPQPSTWESMCIPVLKSYSTLVSKLGYNQPLPSLLWHILGVEWHKY